MARIHDIIDGALRRIRIIPAGESANADDASLALAVFTGILSEYTARGCSEIQAIGAITDEWAAENDKHLEAFKTILAYRLCDEFGISPTETLVLAYRDADRRILRAFQSRGVTGVDSHLVRLRGDTARGYRLG